MRLSRTQREGSRALMRKKYALARHRGRISAATPVRTQQASHIKVLVLACFAIYILRGFLGIAIGLLHFTCALRHIPLQSTCIGRG